MEDADERSGATGPPWLDMSLAVILALAAVGTAWAGFQSAKWGGVQANSYASASADRTESTRWSTEAGQQVTIDVIMFTQWLVALNDEILADPSARPEGSYEPDPESASGLLFTRFRSEFKPAMDAWLATRPLVSDSAPKVPFAMEEYELETVEEAIRLEAEANDSADRARQANQRSDNYVLTAVLFALVLFFASVTGRARTAGPRWVLFSLTMAALLTASVLLVSYPIQL